MAEHGTAIGWTHAPGFKGETWNPTTGCDRVSPGCAHCYALELAPKLRAWQRARGGNGGWADAPDGGPASGPAFGFQQHPERLEQPLRWTKPRMVFVDSMSDLFHEANDVRFLGQVFAVMSIATAHRFLILTKRPHVMHYVLTRTQRFWLELNAERMRRGHEVLPGGMSDTWPQGRRVLPNVWLGVTVENRRFAYRAELLKHTPAAVRFVSAEPLLGPLVASFDPDGHLGEWVWPDGKLDSQVGDGLNLHPVKWPDGLGENAGIDEVIARERQRRPDLPGIDWLIVGGESGPRHRPIDPQWVRDLRDEAQRAGTAFYFKQWGGRQPTSGGRELDGRTWDEWPASLALVAGD